MITNNNGNLTDLAQELDRLLNARDESFPRHDPQNTKDLGLVKERYLDAIQKRAQKTRKPDAEILSAANFGSRPLFVCGYMKSGTTLFSGLLDNHPELAVMLGDSHMIHFLQRFGSNAVEAWIRRWVWSFVSPTGQRPFWTLGDNDNYIILWQYLSYWLERLGVDDEAAFLQTAPYSYYCANEKRPSHPKLWVEKTPRNERDVSKILTLFPQACFVHIARDPFQNLASMKKLTNFRGWPWRLTMTALSFWRSFLLGLRHRRRLGRDRYLLLGYEALVVNPEATMRRVVDFLDIGWHSSLLFPSVNGFPMKANTMFKERQTTGVINADLSKDWRRGFSAYEKATASVLLSPLRLLQQKTIQG